VVQKRDAREVMVVYIGKEQEMLKGEETGLFWETIKTGVFDPDLPGHFC
jgi:hypothetical protein